MIKFHKSKEIIKINRRKSSHKKPKTYYSLIKINYFYFFSHDKLERILVALANSDPDIGYV